MDIPKEIRDKFRRQPIKPKCWQQLGSLSEQHDHDSNGICILKNWTASDRQWKGRRYNGK